MQSNLDVNPAFEKWRSSTGREKEWSLQELIPKMERFATAICWQRIPDHTDDFGALVNGIVWRVIKKAESFKSKSRFSTWFYKIAVNECNDYLRNYKERYETSLEEEMPTASQGVDARIDLIDLLSRLEGKDHLLFRMVAEGEDWKTIGEKLGISGDSVQRKWRRLKRRLRDAV